MADTLEHLEAEALKLTDKERAELARVLLLSLEEPADQDLEAAWAREAERRYEELKAGSVSSIPSEQVLAEARARLE